MLKRLLTLSEEATNDRLKPLTEQYGAHTFIKVRLADVFPISDSGISADHYRFALQSHFDFLVTDTDLRPLFAVEFDGETHHSDKQRRRDAKKDCLCDHFDLPILRINSRYLEAKYRGLDLLAWFIYYWFLEESIAEAQQRGLLPVNEPFDPTMVASLSGSSEMFPLWLSAAPRAEIEQMAEQYPEQDPIPSCDIVEDNDGNLRALAWLRIDQRSGILVRTGMRRQRFPAAVSELLQDIAVFDLFSKLQAVRRASEFALPLGQVIAEVNSFASSHTLLSSSAYFRGPSPGIA